MRRWRMPDGGVLAEIALGHYVELSASGTVRRVLERQVHSVEDELYTFEYSIDGGELHRKTKVERPGGEHRTDELVFGNLEPLDDLDTPSEADVRAAIAAHASAEDAGEAAIQRRIDDMAREFALRWPGLDRSRRRLVERIARYDEDFAKGLLAVLREVVHADRSRPLDAAVPDLERACRLATFEIGVSGDGSTPGSVPAIPGSLGEAIERAREKLHLEADIQDSLDARNNAICLYQAEVALARAARAIAAA